MLMQQSVRFIVIGIVSTLVNYSGFYVLYDFFSYSYMLASACGFVMGVFVGYFFNKAWTFEVRNKDQKYFFKYCCVYLISLFLGLGFLKILVEWFEIPVLLGNVLTIVFTTFTNFFGLKWGVFKK